MMPSEEPDKVGNKESAQNDAPAPGAAPTSRRRLRWIIFAFMAGVFGCVLLTFAAVGVYIYYATGLAEADQLGTVQLAQSTKIYDRTGELIYEVLDPQSGKRTTVQPSQIPVVLKHATIATEDQGFYSNIGVDPVGVARAIYHLARYGRVVSGGSTIAQQLVKNTFLSPEVSIERKLREAILAVEVTRRYPKDQILTMYLNAIYYGNLSYGIQAAAQTYFGKDVSELDLAQASLLAGLPQAPALYDPCEDASAALGRQQSVLKLMIDEKYITTAAADAAQREMSAYLASPPFEERCTAQVTFRYPHFVNYVRAQLEKEYGPEVVYKGGLQVTTTIDPRLQAIAEEEARKQIEGLQDKNVTNASVVILNPHTAEILAMLGSVNFKDKNISGQVNIADALRQPGSSIKPINYVTAFMHGWAPATPIYDLKTEFPDGNGRPPYVPLNYDRKEHGMISARTALANSFNIAAVKTLFSTSTPDENNYPQPLAMLDTARKLGITTLSDENGRPRRTYGLALTLGGGEVKLIELTNAYATFANGGAYLSPTPYTKIVDGKGQTIYDLTRAARANARCAAFEPNAPNEVPDAKGACIKSAPFAYLITNILSDNETRQLAFGANSPLKISRPAAVKTGTTDDFRDNWTIGYTPDLVVGVWVGNANNTPMENVSGVTGAAPIWHNVMERALADTPTHDFEMPAGIVPLEICIDSGLLATDLCPKERHRVELFVQGHTPAEDNVWRRFQCKGRTWVGLVPPRDVGDLIPYTVIRDWASAQGLSIQPRAKACGGVEQKQDNTQVKAAKPEKSKKEIKREKKKNEQKTGKPKNKKNKNK
jgi:membrane peptidoglycan carboxypeptidase